MALVQCPECGRKGVSDSAVGCPGCGYNIKRHFENLSSEETNERDIELEKQKQELREKIEKEELARTQDIQNRLEKQEKTAKQTFIISVLCLVAGLFVFIFVFSIGGEQAHKGLGWVCLLALVDMFFSLCYCVSAWNNENRAAENLRNLKKSLKEYEDGEKRRLEAINRQLEANRKKESLKHPVCPMCGSNNTIRISTLNRSASIAMTGLASSKIGKQYECKKCRHKW